MTSREIPGVNPSQPEKPKRLIKIIKAGEVKKLDADDIRRVPPEKDFVEDGAIELGVIDEKPLDLGSHVELKKAEKHTELQKAREDIKRLFGE